jgi:glycosyltransferase involved in cell wall biosynthesis
MTPRLESEYARLYISVRSVHMERAQALPPAAIVYRLRRYDFDETLTAGLELAQVSPIQAALLLARSPLRVLEINEPLMVSSLRLVAIGVAAVRLRGWLTGRRVAVVAYAIVNSDPWSVPVPPTWRSRLRRWSERRMAHFIWGQIDRICYGTQAALELYARVMGPAGPVSRLIPALPAAAETGDQDVERDPLTVIYLGIFLERKGIDQVLAAWPEVTRLMPGARLRVLGKGPREASVRAAAAADDSIEVVVDPARKVILEALRQAQVLALPSQPTPVWREQVGLPIVEALAAGCSVVTTTETGMASWLAGHGHSVVRPAAPPEEFAHAVAEQLRRRRPGSDVVADLPLVDGRLQADAWLFNRHPSASRLPTPGSVRA